MNTIHNYSKLEKIKAIALHKSQLYPYFRLIPFIILYGLTIMIVISEQPMRNIDSISSYMYVLLLSVFSYLDYFNYKQLQEIVYIIDDVHYKIM